MSVRSAEAGDFEAVAALLEELGRPAVTDETRDSARRVYEGQVASEDFDHLLAEDDGRAIGFCSVHYHDRLNYLTPQAWVPDLVVTSSAHRRGFGRELLAEAERRAAGRGCWSITLESAYFRTEAHAFYGAEGWKDSGKSFWKEPAA